MRLALIAVGWALCGCGLGGGSSGGGGSIPGQETVRELAVSSSGRAWVNREPEVSHNVTTVHWEAPGTAPQTVGDESPDYRGLLLAPEGLYFIDGATLRFWSPGSSPPKVLYRHNGLAFQPALDDENVYFGSSAPEARRTDAGRLPFAVQAFPRDGGTPTLLFDRRNRILRFVADTEAFYWLELNELGEQAIWEARKDGGQPSQLYDLPHSTAVATLFLSDRLYWGILTPEPGAVGELYAAAKNNGQPSLLLRGNYVGGGLVYAFDPLGPALVGILTAAPQSGAEDRIARFPLDGGPPTSIARCKAGCFSAALFKDTPMWSDADGVHPATY